MSFPAHRILDAGFVFLVVTQFINLMDFIVGPRARKRFDAYLEDITLRLDYTKTVDWLKQWLRSSRREHIAWMLFWFLGLADYGITIVIPAFKARLDPHFDLYEAVATLVFHTFLWGIWWLAMAALLAKIGGPFMTVLAESEDVREFAEKYLLLMVVGIVVVYSALWVEGAVFRVDPFREAGDTAIVPFLPMPAVFSGVIVTFVVLFLDGGVVLIGAVLVKVASTLVSVARSLMWRVATFPKGPTAAVTTIGAAFIAVLRYAIRR